MAWPTACAVTRLRQKVYENRFPHTPQKQGLREHRELLIRINKLFHDAMAPEELYEATRGIWRIGPRREAANFAFSVYKGEVKEVYKITSWFPAGTLQYRTRAMNEAILSVNAKGRWEFEGEVAREDIRSKYIGKSVKKYLSWGASNPVVYVNCK